MAEWTRVHINKSEYFNHRPFLLPPQSTTIDLCLLPTVGPRQHGVGLRIARALCNSSAAMAEVDDIFAPDPSSFAYALALQVTQKVRNN